MYINKDVHNKENIPHKDMISTVSYQQNIV